MDPERRREIREELEREIAGLENRLAKLRRFASEWEEIFGDNGAPKVSDAPILREQEHPTFVTSGQHPKKTRGMTRYERIRAILINAGGTLTTTEIMDRLMEEGDGRGRDRVNFYNIVDSAIRGGQRKGWFEKDKTGKATWTLAKR